MTRDALFPRSAEAQVLCPKLSSWFEPTKWSHISCIQEWSEWICICTWFVFVCTFACCGTSKEILWLMKFLFWCTCACLFAHTCERASRFDRAYGSTLREVFSQVNLSKLLWKGEIHFCHQIFQVHLPYSSFSSSISKSIPLAPFPDAHMVMTRRFACPGWFDVASIQRRFDVPSKRTWNRRQVVRDVHPIN